MKYAKPTPVARLEPQQRRRDAEQLEALLVSNFARLLARVRTVLGPGARRTAESVDHLQDVFVEVLREAGEVKIHDEEQLVRHVAAIARNNIRDAARRRREHAFESAALSAIDPCAREDHATTPHSMIGRREQTALLAHALRRLSPEERHIVELRGLQHMRFADIAKQLGRNEDTVRKAYHRALLVLSRKLAPSER